MKKFIFIFLILLPHLTWGSKLISPQVFQVHIKPILNSIIQDYYQMVSLFKGYPQELTSISKAFVSIDKNKNLLVSMCSKKISKECLQVINDLRIQISELESSSYGLIVNFKLEPNLYLNSLIGLRQISEFNLELTQLKQELNNLSFFQSAKIKHQISPFSFIKKIDELQVLASLASLEYIPHQYKDELRTFYFDFIFPIEKQISKETNHVFFNQRIESLNFSINLLNQNLTKRNKRTPEGWGPYLLTIHNKWNSIIRYYKY